MFRAVPILLVLALASCAPVGPPFRGIPMVERPTGAALTARLLQLHNVERARVGVAPVGWDPVLAAAATDYARRIAPLGRLVHSGKAVRGATGENLWMGTRGAYSIETMIGSWSSEQRYFRPGLFPRVSRTGNWLDVGHYTAMIWPTTTQIGCGLAASGGNEVLVCRYGPNGNIDGRRVP